MKQLSLEPWLQSLRSQEVTASEARQLGDVVEYLRASGAISEPACSEALILIRSRVRLRTPRHSDLYLEVSAAANNNRPQSLEEASTKLSEARGFLSRATDECTLATEARDHAIGWVKWLQRDIQVRLGHDITDEELS